MIGVVTVVVIVVVLRLTEVISRGDKFQDENKQCNTRTFAISNI